jgi:hypothetical protein
LTNNHYDRLWRSYKWATGIASDDNNVNQKLETEHQAEALKFGPCACRASPLEGIMKKVIAIAFVAAALLAPTVASAGERLFDGALGAAAGAVVAGPPGLVVGGLIGYTAGPRISHPQGYHRHHYVHH